MTPLFHACKTKASGKFSHPLTHLIWAQNEPKKPLEETAREPTGHPDRRVPERPETGGAPEHVRQGARPASGCLSVAPKMWDSSYGPKNFFELKDIKLATTFV